MYVRNTLKNLIGKNIILKLMIGKKGPAFDVLNDLPIDRDEDVDLILQVLHKWSYGARR